jgi:hypothetical protein
VKPASEARAAGQLRRRQSEGRPTRSALGAALVTAPFLFLAKSDLYLIHQQGWEGAAEHISQPDRIAWKSMCATSEGMEKGEKWCKRAIWRNTLPAVKEAWKSVDRLTSGAFVGMWRERIAHFYSKFMATAAAEHQ